MQGISGDTDIENRLVGTVGEGEGGMKWENSIETEFIAWKMNSQWELAV